MWSVGSGGQVHEVTNVKHYIKTDNDCGCKVAINQVARVATVEHCATHQAGYTMMHISEEEWAVMAQRAA